MHEEDIEEIYHKDDAIQELKEKVKHFEELEIENDKNSRILSNLFDCGIIDSEGNLIQPKFKDEEGEMD